MSYPSVNAAQAYYSSSKDPRYHSTSVPVNVVTTPSAYGTYPSSHPYGHSAAPPYSSAYSSSAHYGGHPGNSSAYTTYSSGGYPSNASTPRAPPSSQYYHQAQSSQAYPPAHSSSTKSYDPNHGSSYSSAYSRSHSTAISPPSDKTYPASPSRPYQCDQCPLSFDRSHDLKRHRDSHSGARPHACDSCGRTFTRKDALKRHQSQKQCGVDDA